MTQTADHQPVMLLEAIDMLAIKPDHWYIDATFGRGGHTHALLQQHANVLALDWDEAAIAYGEETFASAIQDKHLILVRANFTHLQDVSRQHLGKPNPKACSLTLAQPAINYAPKNVALALMARVHLDMRMDNRLGVTGRFTGSFNRKGIDQTLVWTWRRTKSQNHCQTNQSIQSKNNRRTQPLNSAGQRSATHSPAPGNTSFSSAE